MQIKKQTAFTKPANWDQDQWLAQSQWRKETQTRAELVARARLLAADPGYPSAKTLEKLAFFFAKSL